MTEFNETDVHCAKYPHASCQVDLRTADLTHRVLSLGGAGLVVFDPRSRYSHSGQINAADVDERYLISVASGICDMIMQLNKAFKITTYRRLACDLDNLITEVTQNA